jgi:hypothetical protein
MSVDLAEITGATQPSGDEMGRFREALRASRGSLGQQEYDVAHQQLALAESLAKQDEQKDQVARLRLLANYGREFDQAIRDAFSKVRPGSELSLGADEVVSVVEAAADRIVVRVNGRNRRFTIGRVPLGLAVALGEVALGKGEPMTLLRKAAYVALSNQADKDACSKARSWWEEGVRQVPEVKGLMPVLDDVEGEGSQREDGESSRAG